MKPTYDLRVQEFVPLVSPATLKEELPITEAAYRTVTTGRETIEKIIQGEDPRLLVVVGPCSIHDEVAALDYAQRLCELKQRVDETLYVAMRVYFEKPRTNVGWKGLINDPSLDGAHDIDTGLHKARRLLLKITEMGLPTATELLDPITPQYIAGLLCWAAIGARTTESQTHREMASGLSMPVGFKNCTDGSLVNAVNAILAASSPQQFLGIDQNGQTSVVKTTGNPSTHIVMRGGRRPNYDSVSITEALELIKAKGLPEAIMVDCSHANSRKNPKAQATVWQDVINQRIDGNTDIIGMMLESNLFEGRQDNTGDLKTLRYGVSITDACISWEDTERILLSTHEMLKRLHANGEGRDLATEAGRYKIA